MPTSVALTEEEKSQIRFHLGYMLTSFGSTMVAASLQFGVSRPVQTAFLVESAINNLLTNPYGVEIVRRCIANLNKFEEQLENVGCFLAVEQIGEIRLRGAQSGLTHPDLIEREYVRWGKRLCDALGVPFYPYAHRYRGGGPGRSIAVYG
jgi:hypothetical protein